MRVTLPYSGALRVLWSWIERPALSVAEFSDATALRPVVTPDVPGRYVASIAFFKAGDPSGSEPVAQARLEFGDAGLSPVAQISARATSDASAGFFSGWLGQFRC